MTIVIKSGVWRWTEEEKAQARLEAAAKIKSYPVGQPEAAFTAINFKDEW